MKVTSTFNKNTTKNTTNIGNTTILCKRLAIYVPETNSKFAPENGWNTNFLVGYGLFSGAFAISFKECISYVLGSKLLILGINSSHLKK